MITRDIRTLLERLNGYCQKHLEAAVGYCVNRSHYELRWEHLFLQFIDDGQGDAAKIITAAGVEFPRLKKAVQQELESLQSGNSGRPVFSPLLLETMEQAWSIASLALGQEAISSGALLLAALERGLIGMSSYTSLLRSISVATVIGDYAKFVVGSEEQSVRSAVDTRAATGRGGGIAAGEEPLRQFCTNFTEQARSGAIDPILGRDEEIRQAIDILNRRRKNNPILVGEAGVGKTAIVEGIALRIAKNDVPDSLKNVELWGLDLGLLQAGASVKGEFEKRLKSVIDAIKNSPRPTILFIDEAHTLIGAGGSAGQGDAANLLKPALARGELRTMAATTWTEYSKYFEKDAALARRFQLIKVEEPDEEKCCTMLQGVGASYEKYHGVRVTHEAIRTAVTLSHRYISGRQLPDKAVDVLDTACARVKMSQTAKPAALDRAERSLLNAQLHLQALQRDRDAGLLSCAEQIAVCETTIEELKKKIEELNVKWNTEKQIVAAINDLQQKIAQATAAGSDAKDLSSQLDAELKSLEKAWGETPMVFPFVSAAVCSQVISDWTGIPIGSLLKDEAQNLLQLEARLRERVVGQDDALAAVAESIRSAKTGLSNPDAPLGVFLFVGPSGVGKTECALALADILFGGEEFSTVINMSEYQEKHTVSQLKGAPPGYVGYGEGGVLTEAVRRKPYSIVILDEVEKAHIEVMNLFYQVFDKGFMRDGEGREINFRNTVIVMTSNLASDQIVDLCTRPEGTTSAEIIEQIRPTLSAHFQPALLGRCKIVPFWPLGVDVMADVVRIKLNKIASRIQRVHKLTLSYSDELVRAIAQQCTTVESGARNADAIIGQTLMREISQRLLEKMGNGESAAAYSSIVVSMDEQGNLSVAFA